MTEDYQGGVNCPNCGSPPRQQYDTADRETAEYDCLNENCRCMVFRA